VQFLLLVLLFNVHVCTRQSELLSKLESSEATGDSKSTNEEKGGARGGASDTNTPTESTDNGSADGGRGQSENSLTYTKEQVQVVQRSVWFLLYT
jgi:hypothetical protein